MTESNNQTRRERLEAREQAIVAAAHHEFLSRGFDGAKVAAIARRAGVAEGTIYLYFKNKSALLSAVVGDFYRRLTEGAAAGVGRLGGTLQRLEFLAQHHLQSCLDEWAILALAVPEFYQGASYRDSDLFTFNRNYVTVFDGVVREGIAGGDIRDDLPLHTLRDLFFGTLEHAVRTFMVRDQDPGDSGAVRRAASQVMALLGPALGLPITGVVKEDVSIAAKEAGAAQERRLQAIADRLEATVRRLERSGKGF